MALGRKSPSSGSDPSLNSDSSYSDIYSKSSDSVSSPGSDSVYFPESSCTSAVVSGQSHILDVSPFTKAP